MNTSVMDVTTVLGNHLVVCHGSTIEVAMHHPDYLTFTCHHCDTIVLELEW